MKTENWIHLQMQEQQRKNWKKWNDLENKQLVWQEHFKFIPKPTAKLYVDTTKQKRICIIIVNKTDHQNKCREANEKTP